MYPRHTNAKNETKYYSSYQTAWTAAIRLNKTAVGGTWWFEGDEHGWYLEFIADTEVSA